MIFSAYTNRVKGVDFVDRVRLSTEKLANVVKAKREQKCLTQEELSELTGINRVMIGRIEKEAYLPSIKQLEELASSLDFSVVDLFTESKSVHSFIALRSEVVTETEREGVEKLFSMMLSLRQQVVIRSKYDNAVHT